MRIPTDEAKLDILYKIYKGSYDSAIKYAKKISGDDYKPNENKKIKSFKDFKEMLFYKANDEAISEEYKQKKKGVEYLATMMGKEDARKLTTKQVMGILSTREDFDPNNISILELSKLYYTSKSFEDELFAKIRLKYRELKHDGVSDGYAMKAIISHEFFGSD